MPIPDSWPPHVKRRAQTFLALWKYYRMSRTLSEAAVPLVVRHQRDELSDPLDILRVNAFLMYWFASLRVLAEGWAELGLSDAVVDAQLTTDHLDTLKRYRNTVYHFQKTIEDPRILAFEANPEVVGWAMELGGAFQEFFDPHADAINVELIRPWLFAPEQGAG